MVRRLGEPASTRLPAFEGGSVHRRSARIVLAMAVLIGASSVSAVGLTSVASAPVSGRVDSWPDPLRVRDLGEHHPDLDFDAYRRSTDR